MTQTWKRRESGPAAVKFDRTPPQNIEAERSVLGAMLLNPDAVGAAFEVLNGAGELFFYLEPHQFIWDATLALFARAQPVDAVILIDELQRMGKLEAAGGASHLAELTRCVPTSANVEVYARIVRDCAVLRGVIQTGTRLVSEAYTGEVVPSEMLDRAEAELFRLAEGQHQSRLMQARDFVGQGLRSLESLVASGGGVTGLATGIAEMDALLLGLQPSDMIVLAARPSVGKTAYSLNMAAHATVGLGKSCLIFSLEMSKEALIQRMLCGVGRVDSKRLRSGFLARAEMPKLAAAAEEIGKARLFIDDTPGITVMEIRSKARRVKARHGLDLIVIDYLQLMGESRKAENRQVAIAEISRQVKAIARELNVPVVALSQLTREADKDDGAPKLSHLRESGAIEQDADVVVMLARAPKKEGDTEDLVRVHVAKHRNGPTGHFDLIFDKDQQRFKSRAGDTRVEAKPTWLPYSEERELLYEEEELKF